MKRSAFLPCLVVNLLIIPFAGQGQQKPNKPTVRQPVVAGSFYPASASQLKLKLDGFFSSAKKKPIQGTIAALIAPHAGYVFSGEVAASAYAQLNPEQTYGHVFVLGTSHHVYLNGASIYNQGNYSTPLGLVEVDTALANMLIHKYPFFEYSPAAHKQEHSVEVQLPFLQYRLKKPFKIVPIIVGTHSPATCKKIAEALQPFFNDQNLFVVSSDFSHYPSYDGAQEADHTTAEAILLNSPNAFLRAIQKNESTEIPGLATSACGWSSILTLLGMSSASQDNKVYHVKYQNSGDTRYGDKDRVVGYHSFVFARPSQSQGMIGFSLTFQDKVNLLQLARETIESKLKNEFAPIIDTINLSEALKKPFGVFVSLHKGDKLRGCIGQFKTGQPLFRTVQQMALAASFQDYRFEPVTLKELSSIEIEISVLTPLKPIHDIGEFELGKHGIYMVKGNRSGTFLPQVAASTGWGKEEFLSHCAHDKAGIGWDGWKNAQLYTYEALVFSEAKRLEPQP